MKHHPETDQGYYAQIHRWGRITTLLLMLCLLAMGLYLSFVKGYHPGWKPIMAAFFAVAAMVGHVWINLADYITYVLAMGPAATYMSAVVGDINTMMLPSAMAAVADLDHDCTREKRDILAACGVFASVMLNLLLTVILVFGGSFLLQYVPIGLDSAVSAIIPALFGAVFAQMAMANKKTALVALPICIVVRNLTVIPSIVRTLAAIALVITVNIGLEKAKKKKRKADQ